MTSRLSALVAAVSCLFLIAACGSSKSTPKSTSTSTSTTPSAPKILDTTVVARSIENTIKTDRHITAKVICPTGIKQKQGVKFTCTAKVKGSADTPFDVTQTDDNGAIDFVAR